MTETLEFNAADAATNGYKIIWENKNNERPIISGGVEITNWKNEGTSNGIIWASVPDGFKFRQLYVNNEKVKRSRLFDDTWVTATYQPDNKRFIINRNVDQNSLNFDAISEWDQLDNVEINFAQTFVMRQPKIKRFVFASDNIIYAYLSEPSSNQLANLTGEYTFDVFFENNFDFIDEEGEWYLDEDANRVYYKKRGSTETNLNVTVVAPSVERLINIKETEGLIFYGLTFEHSTWLEPSENGFLGFQNMYISDTTGNTAIPAAIHIESSNNVQFERNVIRHTGGTGIMAFDNNLTNLNLIGNAFYETAAGALQLGSDDKKGAILPQEGLYQAVVQNNYFYNIGYDYGAPVVFGTFPYQLDFQNNEMINSLAMGLNLGWGWDAPTDLFYRPIVMYNKFDAICQQGTDSSVYHTRNDSKGALISENWFDNSIKVANFRKLGRYNNSVNDPKFGNIYIDNNAKDNNFVRNVHTNFSANGYEGQNDLHVYGNDEGPNFLLNELSNNPSIKNNAGLRCIALQLQ